MSEVFFDGQTVTASSLNSIAIDLGSAGFSNYSDNNSYTVDSLNNITKALVSRGIVRGDNNQCECTIDTTAGNVIIDTGLCIFANGAKKRIETALAVSYIANNTTYIYLVNDIGANKIYICADTTNPTTLSSDVVPLCMVSLDETLTDMRTFSTANVDIPSANQYYSVTFTDYIKSSATTDELLHEIDVGKPFKYVFASYVSSEQIAELEEGTKVSIRVDSATRMLVKKAGTKLSIYPRPSGVGAGHTTYTLNFA